MLSRPAISSVLMCWRTARSDISVCSTMCATEGQQRPSSFALSASFTKTSLALGEPVLTDKAHAIARMLMPLPTARHEVRRLKAWHPLMAPSTGRRLGSAGTWRCQPSLRVGCVRLGRIACSTTIYDPRYFFNRSIWCRAEYLVCTPSAHQDAVSALDFAYPTCFVSMCCRRSLNDRLQHGQTPLPIRFLTRVTTPRVAASCRSVLSRILRCFLISSSRSATRWASRSRS